MSNDFSMVDLSRIRHWQVMDPAPEFLQMFDDQVLVARILKAQIEFKQDSIKSQMKAMDSYYGNVSKILDKVIKKGPAK
jgi:hypothetical protein